MGDEVGPAVICYSGHTYAERPVALVVDGQRLEISRVETEWTSPAGRGFLVCTDDGRHFKLLYDLLGDFWQIIPA